MNDNDAAWLRRYRACKVYKGGRFQFWASLWRLLTHRDL